MRPSILLLLGFCSPMYLDAIGQVVVTTFTPGQVCVGSAVSLEYEAAGTFDPGNLFVVELSDAFGSFASPMVIGSVTSMTDGTVMALIPTTALAGVGYALRVNSSSPALTGQASSTPLQIDVPPNAGANAAFTVCSTGEPFVTTDLLGGAPDAGGIWSFGQEPLGVDLFQPGIDPPGAHCYAVGNSCGSDTAFLFISVIQAPVAGVNTSISVCASDPAFLLFSVLEGDPQAGGMWTSPGGAVSPPVFVPGTDPAGVYTYVVPGIAPCPNAVSSVNVTVLTCYGITAPANFNYPTE